MPEPFNQPPRDYRTVTFDDLDSFLSTAGELAKKHKITVADVIAAKAVLEQKRRNELYVSNGDTHDEQLTGFAELIRELTGAIESLDIVPAHT